jgi:hypothetical protein
MIVFSRLIASLSLSVSRICLITAFQQCDRLRTPGDGLIDRTASVSSLSSKYETATDLLVSVQKEHRDEAMIESRIHVLISEPSLNVFDPAECLYGPLYCTLYAFTPGMANAPNPLWERISLRKDNIKGQQYSGSGGSGNVINYAQIWGEALALRAFGSFVRKDIDRDTTTTSSSLYDRVGGWLPSFFDWKSRSPASSVRGSQLRTCPDDYEVTVSGASVDVFGRQVLKLPISGQSLLRILYADPRLRIFVSPQSSSDSFTNREWESSGLIVVQCRSDLVTLSGQVVDLTASTSHVGAVA